MVTVLSGGAQQDAFRATCRRSARQIVETSSCRSPYELARAWLSRLPHKFMLTRARTAAVKATGLDRAELLALVASQAGEARARWIETWATDNVDRVAAWLCCLDADGHDLSVETAETAPLNLLALTTVLANLVSIHSPAVLIAVDEPHGVEECDAAARLAATFAATAPSVPVAMAAGPRAWRHYFDSAPESSSKAIARQGILAWPCPPDQPPKNDQETTGRDRGDDEPRTRVPTSREHDELARSQAESLLFAALQADRRTSGLFVLNQVIDLTLGGRPVEVDLLCCQPRLAVEVDGYHHFRDANDYRRDRRKDVRLQLDGWLVFRALAEDVHDDADAVVSTIADTLCSIRKAKRPDYD